MTEYGNRSSIWRKISEIEPFLANRYFGAFSLVEFSSDQREILDETNRLIGLGEPNIAEASFAYGSLFCSVDILHRTKHGWDIIEVKSSTSISDVYIDDMAFQYFVLKNCGGLYRGGD